MSGFDWRPERLRKPALIDGEIDILQQALDLYRRDYEGCDPVMDRQEWEPVKNLIRKLEQLRIGH